MADYSSYHAGNEPPRGADRGARKARSRALLALLIAAATGVLATWIIASAIKRRPPQTVTIPTQKVAVAKIDLPLATTLQLDQINLIDWPATSVPPGTFGDATGPVGRVLRSPVVPGQPIVEAILAPKDGTGGLSAVLPKQLRAMTVKVTEASGVAGFIHPGDYVDVIATMSPNKDLQEPRARIILQNIRVIAVGEELSAQNSRPIKVPVVTLVVKPDESERLALAALHGDLQLTMRAMLDADLADTPGISAPDIYGVIPGTEPVKPVAAPVASGPRRAGPTVAQAAPQRGDDDKVEIIRGKQIEERTLKNTTGGGK